MAIPFERLEGKYEILEKMREGGMGAVYKVRHRLLDEVRVIKMMRPQLADDDVLRARFLREAKTAIRLRHNNLAQIYDFTIDEDGYFFLVMEYIDGPDLQDVITAVDGISIGLVLEIAKQSLGVLGYLHRKEIVHRDISPDNLLLSLDDDGKPLVKLIDLGIAKVQKSDENLTATGTFLGKVRYSSPEHFRSKDSVEVGPRSDLYSFGVVLYELLTGSYPIKGKSISSLIAGHLVHEPLSFEHSDPDGRVPDALRTIVNRSIEKDPDDRFPSARAFRDKLGAHDAAFSLEAVEVERVFAAAKKVKDESAEHRPGSAQDQLNRNFGLATTPAHGRGSSASKALEELGTFQTPGRGVQLDVTEIQPIPTPAPKQQMRALILGAEKLLEAKHFNEARLQLQSALDLDPHNQEAIKLMEALDAADPALAAERDAQRRAKEIAKTITAIREHLEREELSEARRALDLARKLYNGEGDFDQVEHEVAALNDTLQQRRAEHFDREAARLVESEDYGAAIVAAEEALKISAELESAAKLLSEAHEGLQRQKEARKRQETIAAVSGGVARLVTAGRLEAARNRLGGALRELGEFPEATELKTAIDREASHKASCSDHVRKLLEAAHKALGNEDFAAARAELRDAAGLAADHPELLDEVEAAVENADRHGERCRRAKAVSEAAASIEKRLELGAAQEAQRELEVAERLFGREPVFSKFKIALVKLERHLHDAAVDALLTEALGAQRSFSEAVATLEEAQKLAPSNDRVQRLLFETRAAQRRFEQERLTETISGALGEIEEMIATDRIQEALDGLQVIVRQHGDFSLAKSLRARLATLGRPEAGPQGR